MAHCKPEQLGDIDDVLENIRCLNGITEKKKGVFYCKSRPFLHFHTKDGKRWADIRNGKNWIPIKIPFTPKPQEKKYFLRVIQEYCPDHKEVNTGQVVTKF